MAESILTAAGSAFGSLAETFMAPVTSTLDSEPGSSFSIGAQTTDADQIFATVQDDDKPYTLQIPVELSPGITSTIQMTVPGSSTQYPSLTGDDASSIYDLPIQWVDSSTFARVTLPTWADLPATHTESDYASRTSAQAAAASALSLTSFSSAKSTMTTASTFSDIVGVDAQSNEGGSPEVLEANIKHQNLEIGLSIGIGALILILLGIAFWFWQRRRGRKLARKAQALTSTRELELTATKSPQHVPSLLHPRNSGESSTTQKGKYRNSESMFGGDWGTRHGTPVPDMAGGRIPKSVGSRRKSKASTSDLAMVTSENGLVQQRARSNPFESALTSTRTSRVTTQEDPEVKNLDKVRILNYMRDNPHMWREPSGHNQVPFEPTRDERRASFVPDTPTVDQETGTSPGDESTRLPGLGIRSIFDTSSSKHLVAGGGSPSSNYEAVPDALKPEQRRKNHRDTHPYRTLFGRPPKSESVSTISSQEFKGKAKLKKQRINHLYPPVAYHNKPRHEHLATTSTTNTNGPTQPPRHDHSPVSTAQSERSNIIDLYASMSRDASAGGDSEGVQDKLTEAEINSVRDMRSEASSLIRPHSELLRYLGGPGWR